MSETVVHSFLLLSSSGKTAGALRGDEEMSPKALYLLDDVSENRSRHKYWSMFCASLTAKTGGSLEQFLRFWARTVIKRKTPDMHRQEAQY
ncbi:hypothetical protein CEXT_523811 [Caerostris extrusa]|uniref:Uncharacterized protein n=1 Tax=Caerostris extrusa TaxID=172846 RepID=A0AAV4T4F0_CAEEX|nr:hypothetical protein CEXT_523811 [Caerostris extrusa]